jgi:DtxR family Mn-dependent transcriptional regulator
MITHTIEDYLKAIYKLEENGERPIPTSIAKRVGFSATSVNNTLKKLAKMNLLKYEPYSEVKLTDSGKKIALEVIRHHRLLELYLVEALGLSWDQVDKEAEKLEHVLSESLEDRIDQLLGSPKVDPHGEPIPTKAGEIASFECKRLSEAALGKTVQVKRVDDTDPMFLRYLSQIGIYPKVKLKLVRRMPFDQSLVIKTGKREVAIGIKVASHIFVG